MWLMQYKLCIAEVRDTHMPTRIRHNIASMYHCIVCENPVGQASEHALYEAACAIAGFLGQYAIVRSSHL